MLSISVSLLISSVTSVGSRSMSRRSRVMRPVRYGRRSSRNHLRMFLGLHISHYRCLSIAAAREKEVRSIVRVKIVL